MENSHHRLVYIFLVKCLHIEVETCALGIQQHLSQAALLEGVQTLYCLPSFSTRQHLSGGTAQESWNERTQQFAVSPQAESWRYNLSCRVFHPPCLLHWLLSHSIFHLYNIASAVHANKFVNQSFELKNDTEISSVTLC